MPGINDPIVIRGAREHNLRNINIDIPRFRFIVVTGVSGSGKSSLAFDTLFAEGQRRYVESLSSYARQFIGQMEKPDVDHIDGLCPAIAIEQKPVSHNPRSTVATVTEIYDYLRVLFARIGLPHCPECGRTVQAQTAQEIVSLIAGMKPGTRFQVLSPLVRNRKGRFEDLLKKARADGYVRVRIDGETRDLSETITLGKTKKHSIELVVDRLVIPEKGGNANHFRTRLNDSVETALSGSDGLVLVDDLKGNETLYSELNACGHCGVSFPALSPAMFSFNSPSGMCPECNGLGVKTEFDPDLFVDRNKSLHEGGIRSFGVLADKMNSGTYKAVKQITDQFDESMDTPLGRMKKKCRDALLYGGVQVVWKSESERAKWQGEWNFEGTVNSIRRRYLQTKSEHTRKWYSSFMSSQKCPVCAGSRLRPESAGVTVAGSRITEITEMNISEALEWTGKCTSTLSKEHKTIARDILKEIQERLSFLLNVGLHYLTLDRSAPTLSGGEGQRIKLASQIGSRLGGVLYVLDEPSIGLHKRDTANLLDMLEKLRDIGNTVVVIEHDEDTMQRADWIIDLGPGPGVKGGKVVAQGAWEDIIADKKSLTGQFLSGERLINMPRESVRKPSGKKLVLKGAGANNLRNISVAFPVGLFTCVTGVSGSGKSSLVSQTLQPALARELHNAEKKPGPYEGLTGVENFGKVINITQAPIGRTPRSNPATYAQVMPLIRDLFAKTQEAKARGYQPGRFSFNVKGGRCEACRGHGRKKVEMHFLPDVWVTCDVCGGSRFNQETLHVRFKGKNISEVLDMDVSEALKLFRNIPGIKRILETLESVGLGYIKLGQSATTLSGGEAQRIKLARELARVSTGDTVYILDEPTTGLHFADIEKLLTVLHRLVDAGNTVIVIEHNLDVIKTADWVIDLGPEGGDAGGTLVAEGPPEKIVKCGNSHTGKYLKKVTGIQ